MADPYISLADRDEWEHGDGYDYERAAFGVAEAIATLAAKIVALGLEPINQEAFRQIITEKLVPAGLAEHDPLATLLAYDRVIEAIDTIATTITNAANEIDNLFQ